MWAIGWENCEMKSRDTREFPNMFRAALVNLIHAHLYIVHTYNAEMNGLSQRLNKIQNKINYAFLWNLLNGSHQLLNAFWKLAVKMLQVQNIKDRFCVTLLAHCGIDTYPYIQHWKGIYYIIYTLNNKHTTSLGGMFLQAPAYATKSSVWRFKRNKTTA